MEADRYDNAKTSFPIRSPMPIFSIPDPSNDYLETVQHESESGSEGRPCWEPSTNQNETLSQTDNAVSDGLGFSQSGSGIGLSDKGGSGDFSRAVSNNSKGHATFTGVENNKNDVYNDIRQESVRSLSAHSNLYNRIPFDILTDEKPNDDYNTIKNEVGLTFGYRFLLSTIFFYILRNKNNTED